MTHPAGREAVEVVDPAGVVVALVTREEMRRCRLRHRTVFVAVIDTAGQRLLVHRRAGWKDVWPSRWDVALGGVVAVGESWVGAAGRELAEEAGVVVPVERLGGGLYHDEEVDEVAEIFLARSDGPFSFPDGEVVATDWVAFADLPNWLATHPTCPDGVALVLPLLAPRCLG